MNVDLGAKVVTTDGAELGAIKRLILDASGHDVKAAVVEHGMLLKDSYEVPVSAFSESADGTARVSLSADQVKSLPRFDESRYTDAPDSVAGPFGFPTGGIVWPVGAPVASAPYGLGVFPVAPVVEAPVEDDIDGVSPEPDERWELDRRAEQANAVIERGADVISSDGEKVGEVNSISFDPQTGHPTSLLVRQGYLFSEDVEVPGEAVASVDDGVVTLKADKESVDLWSRDNTVLLF